MSKARVGIGIVGCGNIAGPYAKTLAPYEHIELVGVTDVQPQRAQDFAATYGGKVYASLEELLADEAIDLVVNLTVHHAHPAVITQCLEAGKHVHSEKPLAMTYAEAQALVELADAKGLRLSCSPITFMGEAQQTTWKVIRDGTLGPVRLIYAEVNWGRIETWHPDPESFYAVGPLFDVGVYPLTLVTTMFGPARRVTAFGKVLFPDRVTRAGAPFRVGAPDFVAAIVELEDGPVVRLTTNFYVGKHGKQKGLEFHGDKASVYLESFQDFNASVEVSEFNEAYAPVPYVKEPYPGIEWGRAVVEMAEAMAEGRPQRATGAQAAHVVEILCAITESFENGWPVEVISSFTPPAPMEWAQ